MTFDLAMTTWLDLLKQKAKREPKALELLYVTFTVSCSRTVLSGSGWKHGAEYSRYRLKLVVFQYKKIKFL